MSNSRWTGWTGAYCGRFACFSPFEEWEEFDDEVSVVAVTEIPEAGVASAGRRDPGRTGVEEVSHPPTLSASPSLHKETSFQRGSGAARPDEKTQMMGVSQNAGTWAFSRPPIGTFLLKSLEFTPSSTEQIRLCLGDGLILTSTDCVSAPTYKRQARYIRARDTRAPSPSWLCWRGFAGSSN